MYACMIAHACVVFDALTIHRRLMALPLDETRAASFQAKLLPSMLSSLSNLQIASRFRETISARFVIPAHVLVAELFTRSARSRLESGREMRSCVYYTRACTPTLPHSLARSSPSGEEKGEKRKAGTQRCSRCIALAREIISRKIVNCQQEFYYVSYLGGETSSCSPQNNPRYLLRPARHVGKWRMRVM